MLTFLNPYLQRLRARREPGQNIDVDARDGSAPPLGALAHGGAGTDRLQSCGARLQSEERQQRARYHQHRWMNHFRDQACTLQTLSLVVIQSAFQKVCVHSPLRKY